jgi:hypothetical protein
MYLLNGRYLHMYTRLALEVHVYVISFLTFKDVGETWG